MLLFFVVSRVKLGKTAIKCDKPYLLLEAYKGKCRQYSVLHWPVKEVNLGNKWNFFENSAKSDKKRFKCEQNGKLKIGSGVHSCTRVNALRRTLKKSATWEFCRVPVQVFGGLRATPHVPRVRLHSTIALHGDTQNRFGMKKCATREFFCESVSGH